MTDYISREDLLKEVEELNAVSFYELNDHSNEAYHEIKNLIEHISAADVVERNTGKWISVTCDDGHGKYEIYKCDQCELLSALPWKYCRGCGARMVNDEPVD